jgi:hypothetical protein
MPNWKKVIVSGSNAHLNHITASGNISASGGSTSFSAGTLDVLGYESKYQHLTLVSNKMESSFNKSKICYSLQ